MSQKRYFIDFQRYLYEFFTGIKKYILSHPVTSKQPPEIVQIHMRHPVYEGRLQIIYANSGELMYKK